MVLFDAITHLAWNGSIIGNSLHFCCVHVYIFFLFRVSIKTLCSYSCGDLCIGSWMFCHGSIYALIFSHVLLRLDHFLDWYVCQLSFSISLFQLAIVYSNIVKLSFHAGTVIAKDDYHG